MNRRAVVAAVCIGILAAGWVFLALRDRARIAKLFGGRDGVEIVQSFTRATAERLTPPKTPTDWRFGRNYATAFGPVDVPPELARRLATTLCTPSSYAWDVGKTCRPMYGVKLSFFHDADRVDVFLCFACNILEIDRGIAHGGLGYFDDVRPEFVRTAKTLFPNDPEIQSLSELHGGGSL